MKVNSGNDVQADALGGGVAGATGAATATAVTSLTNTGATWTVNAFIGRVVFAGAVYGVILSNTATVLTIDKWYDPTNPGGAAAATPAATATYVISQAQAPANWIALSNNATAPAATDTTLAGELNAAGGGLNRALATYGHTTGATTYTLTKTFTANASDVPPKTIEKIGVLQAQNLGRMLFSTAITNGQEPVLNSGDQLTITETVTM